MNAYSTAIKFQAARFKFDTKHAQKNRFITPGPGHYENKRFDAEGGNDQKLVLSKNRRPVLGAIGKSRYESYVDREITKILKQPNVNRKGFRFTLNFGKRERGLGLELTLIHLVLDV